MTDKFFEKKASAAVLKHRIIDSYATPFASKTGSVSKDNRVAFIDGYAGSGRYEDGSEGSGAMLLRKAKELANRKVEVHFVEANRKTAELLEAVAAEEGEGVTYTITKGKISKQLPLLLEKVKEIPVFVYLDPFGLPIPFEDVAAILDRPGGLGEPATEVLINLTAGVRRFAGMLTSKKDLDLEKDLKPLDAAMGGAWWRDVWLEKCPVKIKDATEDQQMEAELALCEGYLSRLAKHAGGAGGWIIDVKPKPGLKPVYYLLFLTRHPDGMFVFGQSASKGLEHWRRWLAEQNAETTLFGDAADWEAQWKADEKTLFAQWVDKIADGLAKELVKGQGFRIADKADAILGKELQGVVRDTHYRAAINKVRAAKLTGTDPTGKDNLYRLWLIPWVQ